MSEVNHHEARGKQQELEANASSVNVSHANLQTKPPTTSKRKKKKVGKDPIEGSVMNAASSDIIPGSENELVESMPSATLRMPEPQTQILEPTSDPDCNILVHPPQTPGTSIQNQDGDSSCIPCDPQVKLAELVSCEGQDHAEDIVTHHTDDLVLEVDSDVGDDAEGVDNMINLAESAWQVRSTQWVGLLIYSQICVCPSTATMESRVVTTRVGVTTGAAQ